ncbi:MAG: CoA-binding protein [Chloroflexota bacterium]|nr:CoA-binding protein [Chloroflexota bacterium]
MTGAVGQRLERRALIDECVNERVWAVVGASTSPAKWGYRIYKALKESGYRVYPVNPRARAIDGDPCYPSLAALPERPGVVDVVVPPEIGLAIAEETAAAGIERIWFQPGAESADNVARARELGLKTVHNACALVERKHHW